MSGQVLGNLTNLIPSNLHQTETQRTTHRRIHWLFYVLRSQVLLPLVRWHSSTEHAYSERLKAEMFRLAFATSYRWRYSVWMWKFQSKSTSLSFLYSLGDKKNINVPLPQCGCQSAVWNNARLNPSGITRYLMILIKLNDFLHCYQNKFII